MTVPRDLHRFVVAISRMHIRRYVFANRQQLSSGGGLAARRVAGSTATGSLAAGCTPVGLPVRARPVAGLPAAGLALAWL